MPATREINCYRDCIRLADENKMRGYYLGAIVDLENAIRSLNELHMMQLKRTTQVRSDPHAKKT